MAKQTRAQVRHDMQRSALFLSRMLDRQSASLHVIDTYNRTTNGNRIIRAVVGSIMERDGIRQEVDVEDVTWAFRPLMSASRPSRLGLVVNAFESEMDISQGLTDLVNRTLATIGKDD